MSRGHGLTASKTRLARALQGVGAALLLAITVGALGARVNTTASIPVGLYWTTTKAATLGAYVMFCPPPTATFHEARTRGYIGAGYCPGGLGYMMKRVLAAKGDLVEIGNAGVSVNGVLIPHSVPLSTDAAQRPLPQVVSNAVLGARQVLLMSDVNPMSFDARYFGPIDRKQIETALIPIFTW